MSIRFIIVAELRPTSFSVKGAFVSLAVSMLELTSLEVVVLVVSSYGFVSVSLDSSTLLLGLPGTLSISSSKMQLKARSSELSRKSLDEVEAWLFCDGFLRLAFWRKV